MILLNKPVAEISFQDVVDFCEEKFPEGIQVDYKRELPSKELAKNIAAFSNARGGIIIVGVEEDEKSGVPIQWRGVDVDARQIERVHQIASHVEPIPSYDVRMTDSPDGKSFLLIRIYEGTKTPYFVQNDSNIWVRTGNIKTPINIASPDGLELLFNKRIGAEKARDLSLRQADVMFQSALERENRRHQSIIERSTSDGNQAPGIYTGELGTNVVLCKIFIQPYYPIRALASARKIKGAIDHLRIMDRMSGQFPDINLEAVPDGILKFFHRDNGYIESQQINSNGLVYRHLDVSKGDNVWFGNILASLISVLVFSGRLYNEFQYQGGLTGSVSLEGMKDKIFSILKPSNRFFFDDGNAGLLSSYKWQIDVDTDILCNREKFEDYLFSLIEEIYWSFGYENISREIVNDWLREAGIDVILASFEKKT